jgi:hypothetical protein
LKNEKKANACQNGKRSLLCGWIQGLLSINQNTLLISNPPLYVTGERRGGEWFVRAQLFLRFYFRNRHLSELKGFDAFMAVKIHIEVFCVVTPCSVVVG